jgi:hypothetical protein
MATLFRLFFSAVPAMIAFLGTMTLGCDDVGGVPSWERCSSALGTPIIEWAGGDLGIIFSLLIAIAVGIVTWWLLGRSVLFRRR